jgi:uncharacterized membrane protein
VVEPLDLAIWAMPTAAFAFPIHTVRLLLLDRKLGRERTAAESAP